MAKRIYFDHAATSWPKSPAVIAAMHDYASDVGAAGGRGQYRSAARAGVWIADARRNLARLIGATSANDISLHSSGTTALNAAILGSVRPGDHVVTTAAEHNSVLRPLHHLRRQHDVRVTFVDCDSAGQIDAGAVLSEVEPSTRLVAMTSASNVTGAMQPIEDVGRDLKAGYPHVAFLVDAAQTAGVVPIDVERNGIDLLAVPGHKSIGGPLGTGVLYVAEPWHDQIRPCLFGGTGSMSESLEMPSAMPGKLEAGNLNVPAIAGLAIAAEEARSDETRASRSARVAHSLHARLRSIAGVHVIGRPDTLPLVSLTMDHWTPSDVAAVLDAEFRIEVRSGLHCAAAIHDHLKTSPHGTVRVSGSAETTSDQIDALGMALEALLSEPLKLT